MSNALSGSMPNFIQQNASLKALNTFRFEVKARYLALVNTLDELRQGLAWANSHNIAIKVLGEGSNLLLTDDIDALVLVNRLKGINSERRLEHCLITAAAGENWHEMVTYAVSHDLGGIENLALIPGTVGAAPVQNIGAYGVEVGDCIDAVQVINRDNAEIEWLDAATCGFAYRDSLFKKDWAEKYIIVAVRFLLTTDNHVIRSHYAGLQKLLPPQASIRDVYDIVCKVRSEKLPDPKLIGNAGSFFKNPIVDQATYEALLIKEPDLVAYPEKDKWKLAAGWLLERAGWKGHQQDGVGVYEKQALCLVNHGTEDGKRLLKLEADLKADIFEKYGVLLEREPIHLSQQ